MVEQNPLEAFLGALTLRKAVATGQVSWQNDRLTTQIGEVTVDTCCPPDTGLWETGIERKGEWSIVERYPDKASARVGHLKWCEQEVTP